MEDEGKLVWSPATTRSWRETVDNWMWHSMGPYAWSKNGTCPRCQHGISVTKEIGFFTAVDINESTRVALASGVALDDEEHGDEDHFAYCNCGGPHPGRPSGITVGCGSRAWIKPPPESLSRD